MFSAFMKSQTPVNLRDMRTIATLAMTIVIFFAIPFTVYLTQQQRSLRITANEPPLPPRLIIPMYNDTMVNYIETSFKPYVRGEDILMVGSGGTGVLNMIWVNNTVSRLQTAFPSNQIIGLTSGLANVATMSAQISDSVRTIVYNYEPNFTNIPEFNWDLPTTLQNIDQAADAIRNSGRKASTSPTGRPLLQEALQQYLWDYGVIGQHMDSQIVQTQTYCKQSMSNPTRFQEAINRLLSQYNGSTQNWSPQISVSSLNVNGVSAQQGYDCWDNDFDDTIDSKDPGCPGFNVTSFPTAFLLPLYRPSDWEAYLDAIGPHLAPKDYVVVVVGSPESAGIPSAAMTNLLEKIHKDYPEVEPMIMTAGIGNLRQLLSNDLIPNYVNWVGYDYEEGFETEFNWDLQQTKINFQNAGAIVHGAGKKFFTSPQGKNLFDTSLPQWDWNVLAPLQEMVLYHTQHFP